MGAQGLKASVEKMTAAGLPDAAIRTFQHYYEQLESGETGMLPESDIEPVDVVARQVAALRERAGAPVPLVLMNSFYTRDDSLEALSQHPELESGVPADF